MSKNELLARVAAVITTLAEVNKPAPESTFYIMCGMDMDAWQKLRYVLVESKLVSIRGNLVSLTPSGRETADKINAKLR